MDNDRNLVVDVNVVVDLALEFAGVQTGQRQDLETLCGLLYRPVVLENELVTIRVVLTRHIMETAEVVLSRKLSDPHQVAGALRFAINKLHRKTGTLDGTIENYDELSKRSWARLGTDTEDEAIVAAAERHRAAVLTEDKDLLQYLGDRKIAHWSLTGLIAALRANA